MNDIEKRFEDLMIGAYPLSYVIERHRSVKVAFIVHDVLDIKICGSTPAVRRARSLLKDVDEEIINAICSNGRNFSRFCIFAKGAEYVTSK